MGVGAVQQFVQQEEHGQAVIYERHDLAKAIKFRGESGSAGLQGVKYVQRRAHMKRSEPQGCGTHRGTTHREYRVYTNRAQVRAFAGHVRTADEEHARCVVEMDVVTNVFGGRYKWVAE